MSDFATLGLRVDSRTALTATERMRGMVGAGRAAEVQTTRLGRASVAAGTMMGSMVGQLIAFAASAAAIGGSIRVLAGFEQSMAEVAAITRASADELAQMRDIAKELGATTEFTASQAAQGIKFLGMAGFEAAESIAAIPDVLNLATAAGMDLGRAADIASNIMSAFGIEATNAAQAADALAAIASRANTDVEQLGTAMALVGPVASNMGLDINKTAAAIGVLSDAGLQGSMAGTGLRRVLSGLVNPTAEAISVIESLGLKMEEVNPVTNELTDVIDRFAAKGLTAAEALQIFGDRGGPAILALVSQAPRLRELTAEMDNVEGAAKQMADTMRDNVAGDFKAALSAVQGFILALGDAGLTSALRSMVQGFTVAVRGITGFVEALQEGGQALRIFGTLLVSLAATQIPGAVLAIAGMVRGISAATAAIGLMNGALTASRFLIAAMGGPWGILAALVAGTAAYFLVFRDNLEPVKTEIQLAEEAAVSLNAALGTFYQTAAPSSATAAIGLANDYRTLAAEALSAAEAQLALARAEAARFAAAPMEERGLMGDLVDNINDDDIVAALADIAKAERMVADARAKQQQAVTAVTGSLHGYTVAVEGVNNENTITIDTTRVLTGELEALGGAGSAAADDIDELDVSLDQVAISSEDLRQSVAKTFSEIIRGASSARDAIGNLLDTLADQLLTQGISQLLSTIPMFNFPIPGFASGTNSAPGGMALVGEEGPELVNLPRGSQVFTADRTKKMLGGGDGGVTVQNHIAIDARGAQAGVAEQIRREMAKQMPNFERLAVASVQGARRRGFNV